MKLKAGSLKETQNWQTFIYIHLEKESPNKNRNEK